MESRRSSEEQEKPSLTIVTPNKLVEAPELSWIAEFQADLERREIYVYGEIDEDFGSQFLLTFKYMLNKSHDPITIWLNTPGGDLEAAFMFYDLVKASPAHITTIGTGSVCSAGVLMLACGHKRLVTETCSIMSHEGSFHNEEGIRHSEAKDRRHWEDWTFDRLVTLIGQCTVKAKPDKDAKYWKRITERKAEYWILGGEAIVAEGLADSILTTTDFRRT